MSLVDGHPSVERNNLFWDVLSRARDACRADLLAMVEEDFYDDPVSYGNSTRWNPAGANTSSFSFVAGDEAGGSIIMSTGATANSLVGLAPANAIGGTPWTVATAQPGKAFYIEGKFKVTTTPDAVAKQFIGFTDGTNTVTMGVMGPLSTTQFVVQHSANLATTKSDLGALVDTSYHRFAMWSTGQSANVFAQINGDLNNAAPQVVTVVPTVTYSKLRLLVGARNGATAADQRIQLAYLFAACQP